MRYCPNCEAEYEDWASECSDCLLPLVSELPERHRPEYVKLVTVFTTGNAALIAVAKSILEHAGIPHVTKGEGLQDLFAMGRLGAGFNPVVGPVEIQVGSEDEEQARLLLRDLRETTEDGSEK